MGFEKPHWNLFRAYGALTSFCAFNCTGIERVVRVKRSERTFLHGGGRWPRNIGVTYNTCADSVRLAESSFLPFTPGDSRGKFNVRFVLVVRAWIPTFLKA